MRLWKRKNHQAPRVLPKICLLCGAALTDEDGEQVKDSPPLFAHRDRPISCLFSLREQILALGGRVEELEKTRE